MGIQHHEVAENATSIHISSATPSVIDATTTDTANLAFERIFQVTDAAGVNTDWTDAAYNAVSPRGFQFNGLAGNPTGAAGAFLSYIPAGTLRADGNTTEGIFSLDVFGATDANDYAEQIVTYLNFFTLGNGNPIYARNADGSLNDGGSIYYFVLRDGVEFSRNGSVIYFHDTLNLNTEAITWDLGTNGSGATFISTGSINGFSVTGDNDYSNVRDTANAFRTSIREMYACNGTNRDFPLTNMPEAVGNIEVIHDDPFTPFQGRLFNWQMVRGTKTINFNADSIPGAGTTITVVYYALGSTSEPLTTTNYEDGGSYTRLGYDNNLVDSHAFGDFSEYFEVNIDFDATPNRNQFGGIRITSPNTSSAGGDSPINIAPDEQGVAGRWAILYGNNTRTSPGWLTSNRFFCNGLAADSTAADVRDQFVANYDKNTSGTTIATLGTVEAIGVSGFRFTPFTGSYTNVFLPSDTWGAGTIATGPTTRGFEPALTTYFDSDKMYFEDDATLTIGGGNTFKIGYWLQPQFLATNTRLTLDNGHLVTSGSGKYQITGNGRLEGRSTARNGMLFEMLNGSSYDNQVKRVSTATDISGFEAFQGANASTQWFPSQFDHQQGYLQVNFQDSFYNDFSPQRTNHFFAPGIYNNFKVTIDKSDGGSQASNFGIFGQDKVLDNFAIDIISAGSQDFNIFATATTSYASPDLSNPKFINFNWSTAIPADETADGMGRASRGSENPNDPEYAALPAAWWNTTNFVYPTQSVINRMTWRDLQETPATRFNTSRGRCQNFSLGNLLYQGNPVDGVTGVFPYSAYNEGYSFTLSSASATETSGLGTVSMWNTYDPSFFYSGQPLDRVIDSAYYQDNTVEDLKVCIEGLQGLANQPEGSGRLAGGNDVILSVPYPEAGGDVNNGTGYPDMVTNTVNTSANVFDNTQDGKQNHPWAPTNIITSVTHATASSGATTITAPLGQVVDLRKGSTFIQHSSTSVTDLSNAMTITSGGGTTFRWTSGLQIGDVSTANGIRIVSSNNVYETSVTITFDSDNNDSGTIVFGSAQNELTTLTEFYPVFIVDGVTSNHTVDVVDGDTGVITFEPALIGTLDSPTVFTTEAVYVTNDNGLEDIRYYEDNKLLAGATYQGAFNDNNGFNVSYLRGVNVSSLNNGNGSFTIPRLYTDNDDIAGTQINDYFVYRRRNGFRPAFRNIAFNDGEVVEAIQFDPILDPYWESNTTEGIKVFTDDIDGVKTGNAAPIVSTGTVSLITTSSSTGLPNNHNTIYRRIELADNEQLVTGTKTSYGGRASKFSRVFDLDNPVQGNLAVLNETIGITLGLDHSLLKGTGSEAQTINGYNIGNNICEIAVSSTQSLQMDVLGNAGGDGIQINNAGNGALQLDKSSWNVDSVDCNIGALILSTDITTVGNQTYDGSTTQMSATTLTTAAGDVSFGGISQGTATTIDLDAGTLTTTGAATFIAGSSVDITTAAMGSTFLLNDSTMIADTITGGALSLQNNSRLEIFNDSTLSGEMDDSTIITDGDLTLTGATTNMTINGFGGDEDVNLGGVADGDTIDNVADVTYDNDAHITNNTITASGTITLSDQVTGPLGSNSTFTAATISQPSTTGNLIDRCNLIADSVTVTNATDCIMDGTTTNIIIGDSLRNLWLHDGRVNPGAGVTTPTSTEDTITVNGVDLRLTGNITSLGVGSGIRAGYIATLNNFIDGNVDCQQLFVDKNITGSVIDTYQLNSTDFPGNDTITSNITIGKLLSSDADQPTSVIEDNVSSSISLRHNTRLNIEGTQEASTAASISGPTDTNTAQVDFGTPVEGGFLTDITILNAAVSDTADWSPLSFDNVDMDATQVGRIRFQSTGDVNILRGPQPSGTISDFDQSSSAEQAWKEDSPGFVNLNWIGADAVAPIPINTVATANGWEFLVVDQTATESGKIWKVIKGTETSETGVYNLRAEVHSSAQTTVSVSNGIGSDVVITTPADFADAPAGSGDATTPNTEVQAYYDQAPWNVFLPVEPFTLTFTRPGVHRLEVHYTDLGGTRQQKIIGYGSAATDTITLDETEVQINSTANAYTSAADSLGVGMGTTAYLVLGITANIEVSTNNLKSGSFDRPLSTADATARFNSATTTGTVSQKKLFLSGSMLDAEEQSEAALSQIWLEGMSNITQTTSTSALIEIIIQESNANFFGFQQSRFTYNENRMSFTSTTAVSASTEENSSFMLHTGGSATAREAQNIATAGNEFFGINTVPSVTFTSPEQIEEILNERDLTKDNVGNLGLGIPTDVS